MNEIRELQELVAAFARSRNWEQFHTPKNLVMALSGEVGELVAEFQWLTPEGSMSASLSPSKRSAIEMEMADVSIYLLRLADVLNVDLIEAIRTKMETNHERFPS